MSVKKMVSVLLLGLMVVIFSGCNKNAAELMVGSFTGQEEVIKDQKTIKKVKKVLDKSAEADQIEGGLPDYVLSISNVKRLTMDMLVYFWEQEDGTIIFSGDEDSDSEKGIPDYYLLDQEQTKEIKELLKIDE